VTRGNGFLFKSWSDILYRRLLSTLVSGKFKGHFGQYAEDVLVRKYFPSDFSGGKYLDVGAYHPFRHSNTAFFWLKGWSGVNVDANPATIELFRKVRIGDRNICAAIVPAEFLSDGSAEVELDIPFGASERAGISAIGRIRSKMQEPKNIPSKLINVPAKTVNQLLYENQLKELDFFSLDIEGFDSAIIKDFDFSYCTPKMICVEDFSRSFEELTESTLTRLLVSRDYKLVGRAGFSSIFSLRGESF
jgi:hypothetical protein